MTKLLGDSLLPFQFVILRLLLVVYSKARELMFTTLIFVGGVIAISFAGFGTLKLYKQVNIFICLPMSFLVFVGVFVATVFTALGCIPRDNVQDFRESWKREVKRRLERKLLISVPEIGFILGLYGIATKILGPLICEDIMNNVLSLMLVQNGS